MRKRLLDLKASNSLLNLRPKGRGYLRIIDEVPEALFEGIRGASSFSFLPVKMPRHDAGPARAKAPGPAEAPPPDVEAAARAAGLDPSFDLPEPSATAPKKHADDHLQTLLFEPQLEASLEQIRRRSSTLLQELGVPTLFLAFGSLEWYDADASDKAYNAPLVLLPVELTRDLKNGRYVYRVRCVEETEPQTNATLRAKLRKEFGLELPELDESAGLGAYFKAIAELVQGQLRWRVRRWVTLGIFRFERAIMYADLGESDWAPTSHPVLSRLLGTTPGEKGSVEDVPNLDTPEFDARAPLLVTDADSSQTLAVVDALAGKNLVVRGPPGTGKSQTITNLVAAALAEGKSVLFVAEKMAALDVVRKRLEDAQLGEFALELHSTKLSKRAVLDQVKRRLDAVKVPGAKETHEKHLAAVKQARDSLNDYLRAMHTPFGALGISLFDLLWRQERLRPPPELAWLDRLSQVRVAGVLALRPDQLVLEKEALQSYATRRAEVRALSASDEAHPWFALVDRGDLGIVDEEALLAATRAWAEVLADLTTRAPLLLAEGRPPTHEALLAAAQAAAALPRPGADELSLGDVVASAEARSAALRVHDAVARLNELEGLCTAVGPGHHRLRHERDAIVEALRVVEGLGLTPATFGQFAAALPLRLQRLNELEGAIVRFRRLAQALGWGAPLWGTDLIRALLQLGDLVRTTDRRILLARSEARVAEKAPGLLNEVMARVLRLRGHMAALDGSTTGWRGASATTLREVAVVLRTSGWWARTFGGEYKLAWRSAVALLRDSTLPPEEAASRLEHCASVLDEVQAIAGDARVQRLLGAEGDWSTVDVELLQAVDAWAAGVRRAAVGVDDVARAVREAALRAPLETLDAVAAETTGSHRDILAGWAKRQTAQDIEAVVAAERALVGRGLELAKGLHDAGLRPDASIEHLRHLPALLQTADAHEAALHHDAPFIATLGPWWGRVKGDPSLLRRALAWVDAVDARARTAGLRPWGDDTRRSSWFETLQREAGAVFAGLERESKARALAAAKGATAERVASLSGADVAQMHALTRRALAASGTLRGWLLYHRARAEAQSLPRARALLEALSDTEHALHGLEAHYEWLVYRELAHEATRRYPLLESEGWSGDRLARERARFAELDREMLRSQQGVIRARLLSKELPWGTDKGPKSSWTDMPLLKNEVGKQRGHLAIRELVKRAPAALRALTPCFMMSPLSVAQYLPRRQNQFDLLIIDEASQMRPEDALGTLLRAKQAIVVGDEHQLPPTAFFDSVASGDDTEEEGQEAERVESILDWGLGSFSHARELLWHYRSRHESLIAFSNDRFYGGRLLVFPSAREASGARGVRLEPVEGLYEASKNEPEARALVEAAMHFMREHRSRSLGIVAMNHPQAELIETLLDNEIRQRGDDSYREHWANTLSPFFVKNLESVQGDERDAMFVSMTYGPSAPGGPVMQRFGPINGADGHRRLNVLFTRAREQLVVFSSMKPNDVRADERSSRGVTVLKDYLEYAARGGRLMTSEQTLTRKGHDSEFEQFVAEFLRREGFEVKPQVGVQGFFIDLGITHRTYGDGFVCGVECDGAAYHSTRSARDRDRIRQNVLEGLGWAIVRIWSTDWFRNPVQARAKLIGEVNRALDLARNTTPSA